MLFQTKQSLANYGFLVAAVFHLYPVSAAEVSVCVFVGKGATSTPGHPHLS